MDTSCCMSNKHVEHEAVETCANCKTRMIGKNSHDVWALMYVWLIHLIHLLPLPVRLQCKRCKNTSYCSKECQTIACKAGHKHACNVESNAKSSAAARIKKENDEKERAIGRKTVDALSQDDTLKGVKFQELYMAKDRRGMIRMQRDVLAVAKTMYIHI